MPGHNKPLINSAANGASAKALGPLISSAARAPIKVANNQRLAIAHPK